VDLLSCISLPLPYIVQYFGKSINVLAASFKKVACLAYLSALKMEVTCSLRNVVSETDYTALYPRTLYINSS
jgi:hypothetical protein